MRKLNSFKCFKSIKTFINCFNSVQLLSNVWLLVTPGLQHSKLPCPSPTPRVHSSSCPLHRWCNPTILSSVVPFSSCLQSFPASRSFQMSQFSVSGGQSTGISASASVIPSLLQHHSSKESILWCSAFFIVQLSHPYVTTGKTIALTRRTVVGKVMSLFFR